MTTSGAVANPNSSAPKSPAITTSRPVFNWPSVCTMIRSRSRLSTSVCCVSASPSSQGMPACLSDVRGLAPVPPSWPLIKTTSLCALATPAATVPTPISATSFTLILRPGIAVLQVVDQLRQIFDRVDIVMRGRADQPHARRRVPHLGDPGPDLFARKLPPLARLRPLRHLDLKLVGAHQVGACHAEPPRRHLLDRAAAIVDVPRGVFPPFPGIRLSAELIHGDGECLVRLGRDRPVAHGAGGEPLDDLAHVFDFLDRNRFRLVEPEREKAAQRGEPLVLLVDQSGVSLEDLVSARLGRSAASERRSRD